MMHLLRLMALLDNPATYVHVQDPSHRIHVCVVWCEVCVAHFKEKLLLFKDVNNIALGLEHQP